MISPSAWFIASKLRAGLLSQKLLEFRERHFVGVQIRRIGGRIEATHEIVAYLHSIWRGYKPEDPEVGETNLRVLH